MEQRYNKFSIYIHWLMALLILGMFALGWYMGELPKGSPERTQAFAFHKSLGLTLALLALFRLIGRFYNKPPQLPDTVVLWQKRLANIVHHLLYLAMFIQPISGYVSSSFSGYKTRFWGVPLPHWGWKAPELNELFTEIHEFFSICLLVLIVIHLLGAGLHIWNRQYSIIKRMSPF